MSSGGHILADNDFEPGITYNCDGFLRFQLSTCFGEVLLLYVRLIEVRKGVCDVMRLLCCFTIKFMNEQTKLLYSLA